MGPCDDRRGDCALVVELTGQRGRKATGDSETRADDATGAEEAAT